MVEKCETCFEHSPSKSFGQHKLDKEPLTEMEPMFSVSADLWSSGISHHIAMTDRASGYVWHKQMRNSTSATVIEAMQEWFRQVGNPKKLRSDGGPCFKSYEFEAYTKKEKIEHTLSTPDNPRANGLAEKGVGMTKGLWEKEDYDTALQYHNNMLRTGGEMSPSQLFYKRELRVGELPSIFRKSQDLMEARRQREKGQMDIRMGTQTARAPETFELGETVILQDRTSKLWKGEAIVIEVRPDGRSYQVVKENGRGVLMSHLFMRKPNSSDCTNLQDQAKLSQKGESTLPRPRAMHQPSINRREPPITRYRSKQAFEENSLNSHL